MPKDKKVLIVDDNPNMSSLLSDILEIFECKSVCAADGEEALRCLKSQKFDMVITDLRMPKMHGIDLLKTVKEGYPDLPVVVITGFSGDTTRDEAIDAQADGFLAKPFRVDDIQKLLERLLG
jgi:two-component system response regulator PilR (NtrC family)